MKVGWDDDDGERDGGERVEGKGNGERDRECGSRLNGERDKGEG